MNMELLLAYTIVAFFYVTSPGPAIFLAIANGLRSDMPTVALSSSANVLGLFILSTASILGLGVIITTSATLFMIVKIIGAFYLIYLGVKFLRSNARIQIEEGDIKRVYKSKQSYFSEAFLLAVTNPKPILFFTAIFPQFLDVHKSITEQFFVMTLIFLCISFCSLCSYAYVARRSKIWLTQKSRMDWFHRLTGGLFIAMGIGLLQLKNKMN